MGYRYATQREAQMRGLAGWAHNLPDGRVEVLAQGAPADVDALLGFLAEGPRWAAVTGMEVTEVAVDQERVGFEIR